LRLAAAVVVSRVYRRRKPEQSVLYEVIRRHYATFLASVSDSDRTLPGFVRREIEKYMACGILAHGFVRCRCGACGYDRLVAFSCKSRGWCPSCIGRRMAETAAHLTDNVLPDVPMRTWTLTLPYPLRYLLAYDAELLGDVVRAYSKSLLGWLRRRARLELGLSCAADAHPGMITWVQRFGSALNLNVHLHSLATEGVFLETVDGGVEWHTLSAPSSEEVAEIALDVCQRVSRILQARGISLSAEDEDAFAAEQPLLAACCAASVQGFIATGRRAGQRMMRMGVAVADHGESRLERSPHGFNLFAGRCISAFDRNKREHAIRYMARPPVPERRLSFADGSDGDVLLELKRPWSDGTTHVRFTGPELIERLVSLVPPPRVNLVRHHGVFAPNARLRPFVVALARPEVSTPIRSYTRRRFGWAELMQRVFEVDVTICPRCGATGMQAVACITQPDVVRDILRCIGEPTAPPELDPPRWPPDDWLEHAA
jgi:hypothetical protein